MTSDGLLALLHAAERHDPIAALPPVPTVTRALIELGDNDNSYANLVLGRAQLGFKRGALDPKFIVPRLNHREGYTRLLRAAFGGQSVAWLELYRASANYRSVLANRTAAAFFLEQAAAAGHTDAKCQLAVTRLLRARTSDDVLQGQRSLHDAASDGNSSARIVLNTFLVPEAISVERHQMLNAIIDQVADSELSILLKIGRAFRLTKQETMRLHTAKASKRSLLIISNPRNAVAFPLPATSISALELLLQFRQIASGLAVGKGYERRRSVQVTKILCAEGIAEDEFFVPRNLNISIYRSLEAWKKANAKHLTWVRSILAS